MRSVEELEIRASCQKIRDSYLSMGRIANEHFESGNWKLFGFKTWGGFCLKKYHMSAKKVQELMDLAKEAELHPGCVIYRFGHNGEALWCKPEELESHYDDPV